MAKIRTVPYICENCSYTTIKWLGCCPTCNAFDSLKRAAQAVDQAKNSASLTDLAHVDLAPLERMRSGINEWDRVMGGGIVPGSLMILTGDPGIGKSTLLLHVAYALSVNTPSLLLLLGGVS